MDRFPHVLLRSAAPDPKVMYCEGSTQAVSYSDDCIYGANKENLGSDDPYDDPYEICAGCVHLITGGLGG